MSWGSGNTVNKKVSAEWILFIPLMTYVVLRAIYVPPLHDEVATFFHYIETGDIWSDTAMLDANNHLLNSYLSRFSYLVFGEEFWSLRLPNVLAFVVYFWSTFSVLKHLKSPIVYWITLIGLNTIPFVIEYYAMTRGYGLGIAFLMASIALILQWQKQEKLGALVAGMIMAWVSVFANLIFINTFMLLAFFVVVKLFIQRRDHSLKRWLINLAVIIFSVVALLPLISFGLRMKKAGALYYGSLAGLWEVTGKSLSRYTLFSEHQLIKWLLIILLFGIVIWSIRTLLVNRLKESFDSTSLFMSYLLLGNLVITLLLAMVFQVNYPEDRAGIHFVILFIISFAFILDELSLKFVALVLLFFPVSFLVKVNFSQTTVTPDQTLTRDFYKNVRKNLDPKQAVEVYPTQALIWAYYERDQQSKMLVKMGREINPAMDMIVTRPPFYSPKKHTGFKSILYDPLTADYLLKNRKRSTILEEESFDLKEFVDVGRQELARSKIQSGDVFKIQLKGSLEISGENDITVEIDGLTESGERVYFTYYPLRWYYGINNTSYTFELNEAIDLHENNLDEVRVYLFNRSGQSIEAEDLDLHLKYLSFD